MRRGDLQGRHHGASADGKLPIDSTKAEKIFGFKFKSFEEQVVSVASQYLRGGQPD